MIQLFDFNLCALPLSRIKIVIRYCCNVHSSSNTDARLPFPRGGYKTVNSFRYFICLKSHSFVRGSESERNLQKYNYLHDPGIALSFPAAAAANGRYNRY